ncbi:uncharacterized protein LOC105691588 isoform X1 [Athalia rosae]|uniref:uncharacterized protein LOC105691588 isoform X1 n=1 Tax=Athalia rosae TaxID=37344 RepID=UPI002033792D|nr:uncharacterized protein LOC105691588 isoform X1 [Athalia rosae]
MSDNDRYVDYLDLSTLSWKRPAGPPRVWRVVDGRKEMPDGEIPKFSIQEVPAEMEDDVIDFIEKHFIIEEPLCVDQGLADDAEAVRESRTLWREVFRQGASIVALILNADPTAKPLIAGVNFLAVITAEDKAKYDSMLELRSPVLAKIMGEQAKLSKEADVLGRYGVDKYLAAFGLSVHPCLRGQGVGEEILRAREDFGIAYNIPATETSFTAMASQVLANRVGFEVLVERNHSEILDDEGNIAFPKVNVKSIKIMAKKLY